MSKRHNPRLHTVHKDKLNFGHRQCVKPDQVQTSYYPHTQTAAAAAGVYSEILSFWCAIFLSVALQSGGSAALATGTATTVQFNIFGSV